MRGYRDFLDDLRSLIRAGVPVLEALESIPGKSGSARLAAHLLAGVRSGSTLSEAMATFEGLPPGDAALVEAGERSGTLETVLGRMVQRLDRSAELRSRIIRRVAYPACTLLAAAVLLPLPLLVLGDSLSYALIEGSVLLLLAIPALLAWKWRAIFPEGSPARAALDRRVLSLPVIGSLAAERGVGRAFSLLGLLLEAGLPVGESLSLAARAARRGPLARDILALEPLIRSGKSLTEALRSIPLFASRPAWIARVQVGEKGGGLDSAFLGLGDSIEDAAQRRLLLVARAIPAVLIIIGGGIVLAMGLRLVGGIGAGLGG